MKHTGPVNVITFDPSGERAATGSDDGTARVWNARTGEPVGQPMHHQGAVRDVAFDPTGTASDSI